MIIPEDALSKISKLFGVDAKKVIRGSFHFPADEVMRVTIEIMPSGDEIIEIIGIIQDSRRGEL